jgi:hypothetical protein
MTIDSLTIMAILVGLPSTFISHPMSLTLYTPLPNCDTPYPMGVDTPRVEASRTRYR